MAEVELQQIGPYPVTELLRRSSTSDFYRGKQRKKDIVLQRLSIALSKAEEKEAFLTRAKQLRKLKSRNVVNILDSGFDGDHGYLVMEYASGETLQQSIKPGERLAPDRVKRYLSPIADALHYAHLNNTLHGNLHPGALLTDTQNTVLLTDFALTPTIVAMPDQPLLHDEAFAIPYMAPEQLCGHPCPASDQYALAMIAYEWLCGRRPYDATERDLLLQQQQHSPIPALTILNKRLSPAVEQVLLRALAFDPATRFPHAQGFARQYLGALMGLDLKPAVVVTRAATPSTPSVLIATNETHDTANSRNGHTPQTKPIPVEMAQLDGQLDTDARSQLPTSISELPPDSEPTPIAPPLPAAIAATPVLPETAMITPTVEEAPDYPTKDRGEEESELDIPVDLAFGASRLNSIVTADLCQGGVLSQRLPLYEERTAQVEMAQAVTHAQRACARYHRGRHRYRQSS